MYTTIISIIIAALAVSMLVAARNMALLKQQQGHAAVASKFYLDPEGYILQYIDYND
jgi:hypothetical protein